MKVLFAGPSLFGSAIDLGGLAVRPPAAQGDVMAAVRRGALAIGLIDGEFGQAASVGHKEILYALDLGIAVFGASSMGALRAAECAPFGMIPLGAIAQGYVDGRLDDDAAVALTMAPPEFGSVPLTEPLVDAEATLERMLAVGALDRPRHRMFRERIVALHFTLRTIEAIFADQTDGAALQAAYRRNYFSQKRADAELLVTTLQAFDPAAPRDRRAFALAASPYWTTAFDPKIGAGS